MKIQITEETYKRVLQRLLEEDDLVPLNKELPKSDSPKNSEGEGYDTFDEILGSFRGLNLFNKPLKK